MPSDQIQLTANFDTPNKPNWCPGCGNFGVFAALKNAFRELELAPWQILCVEGIGCHGHLVNFLETNHFEGLHGRPLPVAQGAKLANPDLAVFVISGDGDFLGEGGNHFLHALRRNVDLTCLIFNNQRYSLTTGQSSPTTAKGDKTKSSPAGTPEEPMNPIALAIAGSGTFVARSFVGDLEHLTQTIIKAHQHQGLAIVDMLQPCVSFNKVNTFDYFRQRVYKMEEQADYQPTNKLWALEKAQDLPEAGIEARIPIGIFYQEEREVYRGAAEVAEGSRRASLEKIVNCFR